MKIKIKNFFLKKKIAMPKMLTEIKQIPMIKREIEKNEAKKTPVRKPVIIQ